MSSFFLHIYKFIFRRSKLHITSVLQHHDEGLCLQTASSSGVATGWHGWTMSRGPGAKGVPEREAKKKKKKRKEKRE